MADCQIMVSLIKKDASSFEKSRSVTRISYSRAAAPSESPDAGPRGLFPAKAGAILSYCQRVPGVSELKLDPEIVFSYSV